MRKRGHVRRTKLQRGISVFLALVLCVGMLPVSLTAKAEDVRDEHIVEGPSQEETPEEETPPKRFLSTRKTIPRMSNPLRRL